MCVCIFDCMLIYLFVRLQISYIQGTNSPGRYSVARIARQRENNNKKKRPNSKPRIMTSFP